MGFAVNMVYERPYALLPRMALEGGVHEHKILKKYVAH